MDDDLIRVGLFPCESVVSLCWTRSEATHLAGLNRAYPAKGFRRSHPKVSFFRPNTRTLLIGQKKALSPPPEPSLAGPPMLKPPDHQVAGHQAAEGQLGPLVDGAGLFYKPLQGDDRGTHEVAFYSSFSSDPRVPPHVRDFFPGFHGTQLLPASDGSGLHPHLVLDDLAAGLSRPSLIDLKIGARTWYPSAPDDYFHKCLKKDRATTSLALGFRVSGARVHQGGDAGFWRPDRDAARRFTPRDVRRTLRQFVSSNPASDPDPPDCAFASMVYGGSNGVLAQLLELKAWFEDQTLFHFYSASVLVMYEREDVEAGKAGGGVRVKLVDFAHVMEGDGVIDHNFLGGLCSLIKFISEILTDPDECLAKPKKAQLSFENGI